MSAFDDVQVQILHAQPGDIVVLSFPGVVQREPMDQLLAAWQKARPPGVLLVVLSDGATADSVRPADYFSTLKVPPTGVVIDGPLTEPLLLTPATA